MSEQDTYVRIGLADGRQAVLRPQTRLKLISAPAPNLATGQLQVVAAARPGAGRLTIEAGESTVDAGTASFNLFYWPDPAAALAQRAYSRASLGVGHQPGAKRCRDGPAYLGDGRAALTRLVGAEAPRAGLYVHVIDGIINLSNKGGSMSYSPGQFGFTPPFKQPPVLLPANPGHSIHPAAGGVPVVREPERAPAPRPAKPAPSTARCADFRFLVRAPRAETAPRHFGVGPGELGESIHHFRGGLADDDETHDDRLLSALVREEVRPSRTLSRSRTHRSRPATCGRGSRGDGSRSYRLRFSEHLGPELRRQVSRGQQIDVDAEQRFQFVLQTAQVEQRRAG